MTNIIILFVAAFAFRYFRELEDETVRKPDRNWAFRPNSEHGWTAKWQYPLQEYQKKWYHLGLKPKHAERFPYSSTLLVWLTDAEHFYQFVQTISLVCIVGFATTLLAWQTLAALLAGFATAQIAKEINPNIN